jgi:hypothetical protein
MTINVFNSKGQRLGDGITTVGEKPYVGKSTGFYVPFSVLPGDEGLTVRAAAKMRELQNGAVLGETNTEAILPR